MNHHVVCIKNRANILFHQCVKTREEAEAVAAHDPKVRRSPDFLILTPGSQKMLCKWTMAELRSLASSLPGSSLGSPPEEPGALAEHLARRLAALEPSPIDPSWPVGTGTAAGPDLSTQPGDTTMQTSVTQESRKKRANKASAKAAGGKKASGKAKAGARAKVASKAPIAKAGKGSGDQLGREGTLARFLSELIVAGKDNEAISTAAKKKFPKSKSTEVSHVSWQRFALKRRGVKVPELKG